MSAGSEPLGGAADADTTSLEGRTVGSGRFEVRAELGRGGMGEVYLAYDRQRRREVALKLIAARYMGRPERERRFRNEGEYAQRVGTHPNVVSVIDMGELSDCGRLFMTMEPVAGPTLAMELAMTRRMPVDRAVEWARQIARGLVAIHAAGIVHRDLTPSNVLIQSGTNVAKIFDFGLAGELDVPVVTQGHRLTLLGEVPGTDGYMAPEQAVLAVPAVTMDVFAFGVVLTELLVGCNPFAHLDRGEYIAWQQTSRDEAPSIERWGLALPEGLARLIDDCLRRDPKARPQSSAELLGRLDRICPPAVAELVLLPTVAEVSEDELEACTIAEAAVEPLEAPRRLWLAVMMLASFLVVVGGVIGWWLANAVDEPVDQPSPRVEELAPREPTTSQVVPSEEAAQEPSVPPAKVQPSERPAPGGAEPDEPLDEPEAPKSEASDSSPVTSCETRRQRAHDAYARKAWKTVLAATQAGRCWPGDTERKRLRVRALAETGQNSACVRLAEGSRDPEISKWRTKCEQDVWKP